MLRRYGLNVLGALVGLHLLLVPSALAAGGNISAAQARELLQRDPRVFLLDVRTPQEHDQLHLEGSHLIPIDQLTARVGEIPKDRPVLVYCAVGSRSSTVANYLSRAGFSEVYNLYGGIWAWQLRGYPAVKGR